MPDKYTQKALELANARLAPGQAPYSEGYLAWYGKAKSDGCSGGLSWAYALGGGKISCHHCCVLHDFLYEVGGSRDARKKADKLLRECAWGTHSTGGWLGRKWRQCRAWIMWAAVRMFGGRYWG